MNHFRGLFQLALLSSLLWLGACGDGGKDSIDTPTVLNGAYLGQANSTAGNFEFIGAVTPAGKFYGLYFVSSIADIYAGSLNLGVNGNATIPTLTRYSEIDSAPLQMTASITNASAGRLDLSPSPASARVPSAVTAVGLELFTDLSNGVWTGTWQDKLIVGALTNQTLSFDSTGQLSNFNFFSSCMSANTTLSVQPIAGSSLYSVTLDIPPITGCVRTETVATHLTGVAFIHLSPVTGKTQRLDMVMVDSTGSGISFRGER